MMVLVLESRSSPRFYQQAIQLDAYGNVLYCPQYAECIASARTGESIECGPIPMPTGGLVVELFMQALHQPKLFDVQFVERLISDHERVGNARPPESESEDFRVQYMRRIADRYLEYLRWHHQQLQHETGI